MKPAMISFADGSSSWKLTGRRLLRQAKNSGFFSLVEVFNTEKLQTLTERAHDLEFAGRGLGYWRWKPLLVSTYLSKLPKEIPGLWYVDAGCSIFSDESSKNQMQIAHASLERSDVGVFFQLPADYCELRYSKRPAIEFFSLSPSQLESGQIQATAFCIKNSKSGIDLAMEWERLSQNKALFDDSNDEPFSQSHTFVGHRHDQSILSMLLKERNVPALPDFINVDRGMLLKDIKRGTVTFPIIATRHQSLFDNLSMAPLPRAIRWLQRLLP